MLRRAGNVPGVPSHLNRISTFAKSKQGRKLTNDAKHFAEDPKNRKKLEDAGKRFFKRGKPQ